MTLPFQITLIPQYILMVKFNWTDTYFALIIPYFMNAMGIILFRQHFKTIPKDLIDAASLDGCNESHILFRILWPYSFPTLVTVGILTFMATLFNLYKLGLFNRRQLLHACWIYRIKRLNTLRR